MRDCVKAFALTRQCLFAVAAALLVPSVSIAQSGPICERHGTEVPVVAPIIGVPDPCAGTWSIGGTPSAPVWSVPSAIRESNDGPPIVSTCWAAVRQLYQSCLSSPPTEETPATWSDPWLSWGFSLNMDLFDVPSIGDFLPPSPTIAGSPAALVPNVEGNSPTGWQGLSRPTLQSQVDLITGLPLVQVQDLELPLDGASFRLMRTRSQYAGINRPFACPNVNHWWDWTGQGWMISENPLLLIDSAIADVVGNQPRTSYLVLDAHHSIPFQLIESNGVYEAPARFRARLSHNGVWDAQNRKWGTRPSHYTASLYDGQLTYTFVAVYEDVPKTYWNPTFAGVTLPDPCPVGPNNTPLCERSMHDRPFLLQQFRDANIPMGDWDPFQTVTWQPFPITEGGANPGIGIPYYGLCTRVADNYGHEVEINYCGPKQYAIDDPASGSCVECAQSCPSKGQIRSIVLKTSGQVRWTLQYQYRIAQPESRRYPIVPPLTWPGTIANIDDVFGKRVIDSIYVYENDRSTELNALSGACAPISSYDVFSAPAGSEVNALDAGSQLAPLTGWKYHVRYHYSTELGATNNIAPYGRLSAMPVLLKTTVESVQAQVGNGVTTKTQVFKYQNQNWNTTPNSSPWLEAVYTYDDVDRVISLAKGNAQGQIDLGPMGSISAQPWLTPNHLAFWKDSASAQRLDEIEGGAFAKVLKQSASLRLTDAGADISNGTTPSGSGPRWEKLITPRLNGSQYIKQEAQSLVRANALHVNVASIRGIDGLTRHYRLYRLAALPDVLHSANGTNLSGELTCQPSVFFSPYPWLGYQYGNYQSPGYRELADPPQRYTDARWVTVVDEFSTAEEAWNAGALYGDGSGQQEFYETRPGQISRRVVEVGPTGVTLRDRNWQFTPTGVLTSGDGLGEEYIYETAARVIAPHLVLPNAPSQMPPEGVLQSPPGDPVAHLRRELLLVEHRSVGWSAAYLDDDLLPEELRGSSAGLVRFVDYRPFVYRSHPNVPPPTQGWDPELVVNVLPVAEGIKRGRVYAGRDGQGFLVANTLGGPKLYTAQIFRPADPNNPPLINGEWEQECQVSYSTPKELSQLLPSCPLPDADPGNSPEWTATHNLTKRASGTAWNDTPVIERPVICRMSVGAPTQQRPTGQDPSGNRWYFPVHRQWFDEQGSSDWSAMGLVWNIYQPQASPGGTELQSVAITRSVRDDLGRLLHTIIDFGAGSRVVHAQAPALPSDLGQPPDSWSHIAATPALNYVSSYEYYGDESKQTDIYLPDGRRWASRVVIIRKNETVGSGENPPLAWNIEQPPGWQYDSLPPLLPEQYFAREYVFNDLEGAPGSMHTTTLGEIRDYSGKKAIGSPVRVRRVYFAQAASGPISAFPTPINLQFDASSQPRFIEEARVQAGIDSNGRLARLDLLEADPTGAMLAVGSKEMNDLVDMLREREIDGTITRSIRNLLGQVVRRYVGTLDTRWSTQSPSDPDNMVLVERAEYGTGINNAWLPVATRRYTNHPAWAQDPFGQPPTDDADGFVTEQSYDWRMRQVRVDVHGESASGSRKLGVAPRLMTSLTYHDHLDRPIVSVVFGAGTTMQLPQSLDPVLREDAASGTRPDVNSFFDPAQVPLRPISLEETFYAPDGGVTEVRTYDMSSSLPSPRFHSALTYRGMGGQEVYGQRPDQPVSVSVLDGVGRVVARKSLVFNSTAGWYEVSRTDLVLDANGNVTDTRQLDRVAEDANVALTADGANPNAVRSRSVTWFDASKRTTASSDLGTEQNLGYVAGPAGFTYSPTGPELQAQGTQLVFAGNGVPATAQTSVSRYDLVSGHLTHIRNTDGTITELLYDRAGRVLSRLENRFGDPSLQAVTSYRYQYGRMIEIRAKRTSAAVAIPDEVTTVTYGADIVSEARSPRTYSLASRNNGLVGRMSLPNTSTGQSTQHNDIVLRYTFEGKVAERIDGRGIAFRYFYDGLGRVTLTQVGYYSGTGGTGTFTLGYPAWLKPTSGAPVDRIGTVEYQYDAAHNLSDITAKASLDGSIVSHNHFDFDPRHGLTAEWQSLGKAVNSLTPVIDYAWTYRPSTQTPGETGTIRLASMQYPAQLSLQRRSVTFGYGATGSTNDQLARTTSLVTNIGPPTIGEMTYTGMGYRGSLSLANSAIIQTLNTGAGIGLAGLDMFGRLTDLHYQNTEATPRTLFRGRYTYDTAGNRLSAVITQATLPGGATQDNTRSQLNMYDALSRLVGTQVGPLDMNGSNGPEIPLASRLRSDTWQLDLLGNWAGVNQGGVAVTSTPATPTNSGRFIATGTGAQSTSITHTINGQNELTNIATSINGGTATNRSTFYDVAGNMIFDGSYLYQYDAWDRVVQINVAQLSGSITPNPEPPYPPPSFPPLTIGAMVKHFTYDGVGRLIRTESPYPNPSTTTGQLRTERFYYDGIRRIQEIVTDPILDTGTAAMSGDSDAQSAVASSEEVDPTAATLKTEENQQAAAGGNAPVVYLDREYVWGPGDGNAGIDELLVQYDRNRLPGWIMQDGGGDVAAVADLGGAGGKARVVGQWTYDAYGAPVSADTLYTHSLVRCGHKGLFVDRLDGGIVNGSGAETPRLAVGANLIVQMRNRAYSPSLGRFMQADPKATAMTLIGAASHSGRGVGAIALAFSMDDRFTDGANLYQYLGSNPWQRHDVLGLSEDPFEMVDDYVAEDMAQRIAATEAQMAYWQQVGEIGLSMVPVVGSFMAGQDIGRRLARGEDLEFMDYVTIGAHVLPIVGAAVEEGIRVVGKARQALERLRYQYAARGARSEGALGQKYAEYRKLAEKGIRCYACMSPDTQVWTPTGTVPLCLIQLGQLVLSSDEGPEPDERDLMSTSKVADADALCKELSNDEFRAVHVRVTRADGSILDVHRLVRTSLLTSIGLKESSISTASVWMDDIGESDSVIRGGWARVMSIGPVQSLGAGVEVPVPGAAPVLGIIVTTNETLWALSIESSDQPLLMTASHRIWSETQKSWISSGDLKSGEMIRTAQGQTCVKSISLARAGSTVYNLSVAGGHTYFVGDDQVWVHNSDLGCFNIISIERLPDDQLVRAPRIRGQAPKGPDGKSIEIHHVGQNPEGPFIEITSTNHRRVPNPLPGLTEEERKLFNAARRRYWEREWDRGRFRSLPK